MKNILIIGGTRNMGHYLTLRLIEAGHQVTILNRGINKDSLPETVHRLHADRTDLQQMRRALLAKSFDIVVDFVIFNQAEAQMILDLLGGSVEHYVMVSSGQVYLVREGIEAPYKESDYGGRTQPMPKEITFAHEEWKYGMGKRGAEDTFIEAWERDGFPFTSLRLPMVNSERDQFNRLYNYIIRIHSGGPIVAPRKPNPLLCHVYALDVVEALFRVIERGQGKGKAYNIAQDEAVTLDEFVAMLADIMGKESEVVRFDYKDLQANGFLPDCSPFSERWMSYLDNSLSKSELGMTYTPLRDYLEVLVNYYLEHRPTPPRSFKRRPAELQMIEMSKNKDR